MRAELPIHPTTTCNGCDWVNSVSRLDRMFWNDFGQRFTPARSMIRNSCDRRFLLASRCLEMTYSVPSGAASNAASKCGRSSGNKGTIRDSPPALCSVFGLVTVKRLRAQSMSPHRKANVSLGLRRPPKRARATMSRHSASGHLGNIAPAARSECGAASAIPQTSAAG
jgi:hypothetical protein